MRKFVPRNGVMILFFLNIVLLFFYVVGLPMDTADIILTQMGQRDFSAVNVTNLMYYVVIFGQIALSMSILVPVNQEQRHILIKLCMGVVSAGYLFMNWWVVDWVISFFQSEPNFSPDFIVFRDKSNIVGDEFLWGVSGIELIPLNLAASYLWYKMAYQVNRDREEMVFYLKAYMVLQFVVPHTFLLLFKHRLMNRELIKQSVYLLGAQVLMLIAFIFAATKREIWKESICVFYHKPHTDHRSDGSHHRHHRHHHHTAQDSGYRDITGCVEEDGVVFDGTLLHPDHAFYTLQNENSESDDDECCPEYYI